MNNSAFWDIPRCSLLKVNRRFGESCRLHLHGRRIYPEIKQQSGSKQNSHYYVLQPGHSSTLKMEAKYPCKAAVGSQRATRLCIPQDIILHNHCCESECWFLRQVSEPWSYTCVSIGETIVVRALPWRSLV
jgi:hypothetical protein